ncbi:MAG: Lipid-A-disaccharide synthase [Myxococcota bacterium]|nr:Lipid-A-disaccharide synthase [Myxococcota bacterium]
MSLRILISTGETSGDLAAAEVISALRRLRPGIEVSGTGGPASLAAGLKTLGGSPPGVMGFVEVFRGAGSVGRNFSALLRDVLPHPPSAALLVDFTEFNMALAHLLHRMRIPLYWFVAPQAWAWREGRVKDLARLLRRLFVVLPFEQEWFRARGVNASYHGHPAVDRVEAARARLPARDAPREPMLAILPGSREAEIRRVGPVMRRAWEGLRAIRPGVRACLPVAPGMEEPINRCFGGAGGVEFVSTGAMPVLLRARAGWITSGTASLEAGLACLPHVCAYAAHPLTIAIARRAVRVPHISLVNLCMERLVIPELVQESLAPGALIDLSLPWLDGGGEELRGELSGLAARFGPPGVGGRIAGELLSDLSRLENGG